QHIPHKGSSQAMVDLIAGNVMIGSMTWSSAVGQVRAGTVVPIAVSSSTRVAEFPHVPTLQEEGFDDLVAVTWYALSGPAGLSSGGAGRPNKGVNAAGATRAWGRRLADDAIVAEPMSSQAVTAFVTGEVRKWGPISRRVMTNP